MPGEAALLSAVPGAQIPGAVLGVAQTVASLINSAKAKKEAKALERSRPKREISPLYEENLALAESELAGGMSAAAEAAYNQALDRQQSGSLSALLRGGGDVNTVSDIFSAGEEGRQRLATLTDQLRLKQIDTVLKSRDMMAEEADKNFIFNDYMPWADKAAANATARKEANAGIWSGLQTLGGSVSNMIGAKGADGGGESGDMAPDGQSMWEAYKKTQEMENAAQGNYVLPDKYNTQQARTFSIPETYGLDVDSLYSFLNRGR